MISLQVFPEGPSQPSQSTNMPVVQDHTDAYKPNDLRRYEFTPLGWLKMINLVTCPTEICQVWSSALDHTNALSHILLFIYTFYFCCSCILFMGSYRDIPPSTNEFSVGEVRECYLKIVLGWQPQVFLAVFQLVSKIFITSQHLI